MRGAHRLRGLQLAVVDVDRDDLRRARQACAHDGRVADAAAADDRDRVAAADLAGVDRGADARHDAAAEEARDGRGDRGVDLGALAGRDEGLLGEGADAERGRELGPVEQGHLLLRVVGVEAVLRASAQTRTAIAAHRTPVEDHEVAGGDVRDALPHRFDDARRLVTEEEGELVVDPALLVVEIGVTDPAGLDLHHGLAGTRVGDDDRLHADGLVLAGGDDPLDLLCHAVCSLPYGPVLRPGHSPRPRPAEATSRTLPRTRNQPPTSIAAISGRQ